MHRTKSFQTKYRTKNGFKRWAFPSRHTKRPTEPECLWPKWTLGFWAGMPCHVLRHRKSVIFCPIFADRDRERKRHAINECANELNERINWSRVPCTQHTKYICFDVVEYIVRRLSVHCRLCLCRTLVFCLAYFTRWTRILRAFYAHFTRNRIELCAEFWWTAFFVFCCSCVLVFILAWCKMLHQQKKQLNYYSND